MRKRTELVRRDCCTRDGQGDLFLRFELGAINRLRIQVERGAHLRVAEKLCQLCELGVGRVRSWVSRFLRPPSRGDYPYEFMSFFASAGDRINQEWPEPARLGPPVSDGMTTTEKDAAKLRLTAASDSIRVAINFSNRGQNGEALRAYRKLFGDLFPLS